MSKKDFEAHSKNLAAKYPKKVVYADDKPNYHRNKLFGGLFRIAFVVVFLNMFGIHWNEKVTPILKENISVVLGQETGNFLSLLLVMAGHLTLLVMLVKGVYKVLTFNQYIDDYEGKNLAGYEISQRSRTGSTSNIDKVYAYRNSKMAGMTPSKAADLHIQTSKLGGSASNPKVEGYINSKLAGMSPEKGLNFLKGKS